VVLSADTDMPAVIRMMQNTASTMTDLCCFMM
jgi:hypothetical protein